MLWLIGVVVAGTLMTSFFCSLAEASILSIPSGRVETLRREGTRHGKMLASLTHNIDETLAGILVLNTLANTVGATMAGALVQRAYDNTVLSIFSAAFTFSILFFAEVIPKTLGVVYANKVAPVLSIPLLVVIRALFPIVKICEVTTKAIKRGVHDPTLTEEDILSEARLGVKSGKILPEELEWMGNILKLNDITVKQIMTPRSVIFAIDADDKVGELKDSVASWNHSRIPVTKDHNLDETMGIVLRRQVIDAMLDEDYDKTIGELARPAHYVPESMRGHQALKELISKKQHLLIVVDEHGGTEGLITLEDIVEVMLGEQIVDEYDRYTDLKELARILGVSRLKELNVEE